MSRNGQQHPGRPEIRLPGAALVREGAGSARAGATPSPEEAAAIAAAIEQFLRDTAPPPAPRETHVSPWLRAGLFEGTGRGSGGPSPWGDVEPWGS
jgi:hypothetical protein